MGASTLTEQTLNNLGPPTRLIPGDVVAAIAGPLLLAVTNALVAVHPGGARQSPRPTSSTSSAATPLAPMS